MPALSDRTSLETALLAQLGFPPAGIFDTSSNDLPHIYWVSPAGADGAGSGRMSAPFLTIARAIRETRDGRGDTVAVCPGSYAETIDIGSGSTTYGSTSTNGYQKRNLKIIGVGGGHNGLVQIIGDGATAQPTVRVQAGYLRGFVLKGIELDTNTLAQPALELITSDTGATPVATSNHYRAAIEDVSVRSNDPAVGILCTGTNLVTFRRLHINGPTIGIGFTGSANNTPSDLEFEDVTFTNDTSSTTTAWIATVQNNIGAFSSVGGAVGALDLIHFRRVNFACVRTGTGGRTNDINLTSTVTANDVTFFDCRFSFAPTNGTNGIATLPTNVVVLGHGTSGLVSLKG